MKPNQIGRKGVYGGANATLVMTEVEAGEHWNLFNFMSIIPRLFFPSPTRLHSEMVVQPFIAAFTDIPPTWEKKHI